MKETPLPMMPFFVGDYITGTRSLTLQERGAYTDLLFQEWAIGPLPKEPARLASLLGCTTRTLERLWKVIGSKFEEAPDGYINRRLESERRLALAKRARNVEKATGAAKARWELRELKEQMRKAPSIPSSNAASNAPGNPTPVLEAMLEQCPPSPSPSPSPHIKTLPEINSVAKRARSASPRGSRARPNGINEQDPEVQSKRRQAAALCEQQATVSKDVRGDGRT